MTHQSTLIHAAELLEREAVNLRWRCCDLRPDSDRQIIWAWRDKEDEIDFLDLLQTAAKLREMAEKEGV